MNKKGVSAILAIILIILIMMILVSTIVIFSKYFFNTQRRGSTVLSPQFQKLKITIDSVNISSDTMTIIIERGDNEGDTIPLKGVRFKLDASDSSYTVDRNDPPIDAAIPKTYTISLTDVSGLDSFYSLRSVSVSGISQEGTQTLDLDTRGVN